MAVKFELIDTRGRYLIHENGEIQRTDMIFTPSESWRLRGLANRRGRIVVLFTDITPEWLANHPLDLKNGEPRYQVCDIDHGTNRQWGSEWGSDGVRAIRFNT